jgi:S-adenosylmethionine:tRNA ribosyltransferase-isomerase
VIPARLLGKKKDSGGRIEVFLLKKDLNSTPSFIPPLAKGESQGVWQCLLGGKGSKEGLEIIFNKELTAKVLQDNLDGTWLVGFNRQGKVFEQIINKIGHVPLPPYIKRQENNKTTKQERKSYQTVYADDKKGGSVAAPTAGLHFTKRMLDKIRAKGVKIRYITLHVGLGTFAPVKIEDFTKHQMHSEYVEVSAETIADLYLAKHEGRRVIAVGTTSVRTLEAMAQKTPSFILLLAKGESQGVKIKNYSAWVNIFIYPPYKFKVVDAMITNFHLPKSTLLMLISALAGKENIDRAYQEAIRQKYRFYSYGDAMLIQ